MDIDFESRIEDRLADMQSTLDRILAIIDKPKAVRKPKVNTATPEFERWWGLYPKKIGKKKCLALWNVLKLEGSTIAMMVIDDTRMRLKCDQQWVDGYAPHPKTYLNGERWCDSVTPIKVAIESLPRNDNDLERWAVEKGYPTPGRAVTYRQYRAQLTRIHNEPGDQP
jgi:hypothetical protein